MDASAYARNVSMPIPRTSSQVRGYLRDFGTVAIAITERGHVVLTHNPVGQHRAWWLVVAHVAEGHHQRGLRVGLVCGCTFFCCVTEGFTRLVIGSATVCLV